MREQRKNLIGRVLAKMQKGGNKHFSSTLLDYTTVVCTISKYAKWIPLVCPLKQIYLANMNKQTHFIDNTSFNGAYISQETVGPPVSNATFPTAVLI